MLKCTLICAAAAVLSFLLAGFLSHIPVGIPWLRERGGGAEIRRRFYLGCALFLSLGVSGALAAAWGYLAIAVISLAISLVGGGMAVFCVSAVYGFVRKMLKAVITRGGGNCERPVGSDTYGRDCVCEASDSGRSADGGAVFSQAGGGSSFVAESGGELARELAANGCAADEDTDQIANGGEASMLEEGGRDVADKNATDDYKYNVLARIAVFLTRKTRTKAIVWCAIFAVNLVVFSLFVALSGEDGMSGAESATVALETAERADDAVFFTANGGIDTYAIFGYAANSDGVSELTSRVDGVNSFTVRRVAMNDDKWGMYYLLLDVRDADGRTYIAETETLEYRARAVSQKRATLGGCVALCGIICIFYTVAGERKRGY